MNALHFCVDSMPFVICPPVPASPFGRGSPFGPFGPFGPSDGRGSGVPEGGHMERVEKGRGARLVAFPARLLTDTPFDHHTPFHHSRRPDLVPRRWSPDALFFDIVTDLHDHHATDMQKLFCSIPLYVCYILACYCRILDPPCVMLQTACGLQPQPPAASVRRSALMRTVQLLGADVLLVQVPGSPHGPQLRYGCRVINQIFLSPETGPNLFAWTPRFHRFFISLHQRNRTRSRERERKGTSSLTEAVLCFCVVFPFERCRSERQDTPDAPSSLRRSPLPGPSFPVPRAPQEAHPLTTAAILEARPDYRCVADDFAGWRTEGQIFWDTRYARVSKGCRPSPPHLRSVVAFSALPPIVLPGVGCFERPKTPTSFWMHFYIRLHRASPPLA